MMASVRIERKRENKPRGNWGKKMAVAPPRPPPAFSRFLPSFSQFALSPLHLGAWTGYATVVGASSTFSILRFCLLVVFFYSKPVSQIDFRLHESTSRKTSRVDSSQFVHIFYSPCLPSCIFFPIVKR